jgi:hypothetical protein
MDLKAVASSSMLPASNPVPLEARSLQAELFTFDRCYDLMLEARSWKLGV